MAIEEAAAATASDPAHRPRPRDRKARIATVAAEAFSERGYHGVAMGEIASAVGISAPALYRHYPGKYAMFRSAVTTLAADLAAAAEPPDAPSGSPSEDLDALLDALARTSLAHRRSGGLYRWQARVLAPEDRPSVAGAMRTVRERLAERIAGVRPALSREATAMRTTASLSILGSITGHRSPLAARRIPPLLTGACRAVIESPAPAERPVPVLPGDARFVSGPPAAPPAGDRCEALPGDRREALLREAVRLFARRGYHETAIGEIASAAGLTASGVYRYFDGKQALLDAAFSGVSAGLGNAQERTIAAGGAPDAVLRELGRLYVRRGFRHPDQMIVYFAEVANLPPARRRAYGAAQRTSADAWAGLLIRARPELTRGEARYLVQAVFALILDVGRSVRFSADPQVQRDVEALLDSVLLGR